MPGLMMLACTSQCGPSLFEHGMHHGAQCVDNANQLPLLLVFGLPAPCVTVSNTIPDRNIETIFKLIRPGAVTLAGLKDTSLEGVRVYRPMVIVLARRVSRTCPLSIPTPSSAMFEGLVLNQL
jgi:hypothetical protein